MIKKVLYSGFALSLALLTTGCFKEKKLPVEQLITIYDSNLKETNKLAPLETMYVKIGGLAPNQMHRVEILDPNKKLVSEAEVLSNEKGVIEPFPIWYDIGLQKQDDGTFGVTKDDLSIKAFYVKVKSLDNDDTDFEQNFFLLLKKPQSQDDMPKPVVSAVGYENNESNMSVMNSFFETGSKTENGSDSNLTKVYVKADQLPYHTIKDGKVVDTDKVDIYVVPFSGALYEDGMDLEEVAVTYRKDVDTNVSDDKNYRYLEPTLVWDLNRAPKLMNPGDSNNAYSIIIDTNQNGKFDIGEDLDGDGKYDRYIDGADGQGAAGFIILNTEANDLDAYITDQDGNKIDSVGEKESGDKTELHLTMNNIPTTEENVTLYVIDNDGDLDEGTDLNSSDVRKEKDDGNKGTNADITAPDNNNTFMAYIDKAKVLVTQDEAGYGYTDDIKTAKKLDVVVDVDKDGEFNSSIDYYLPNILNVVPFDANVSTTIDEDGEENSTIFNEARSDSNTTIYIRYGDDNSGGDCDSDDERYAYLYRADEAPQDGDELFGEILRRKICVANNHVTKYLDTTDLLNDDILKIINPTDKNNKYVIVIDKDDDHKYKADDEDKILNIAFKDTSANDLPEVSYINLASGGLMGRPYQHWTLTPYTSAYDYRDVFNVNADNTTPTEWWWARYWTTKGVKVVWNPYVRNRGWWWWHRYNTYVDEKGVTNPSPLNNRQIVDLYIISADKYKLKKDMALTDNMDIRGRHMRLPVQVGCRNGYHLQTVWKAPLKVGRYYMIVDVNRNGKIDDGIDLIDAVTKTGVTIKEDPSVVGFSVE